MFVYGANLDQVELVVLKVSAAHYAGNIMIRTGADKSNSRGGRATFTLRATAADAPGSRSSAGYSSSGTGPRGLRRTVAACWHAHYDVLAALFAEYPAVRVNTMLATYTSATFHDRAMATADQNVGTLVAPRYPTELCTCDL